MTTDTGTQPYYSDASVTLLAGDCLDVLRTLPDCSVDSVVTDPPYGLGFMGHEWDQPGEYGALRPPPKGSAKPMHPRDRGPDQRRPKTAATAGSYDLSPSANRRFGQWCEAWAAECLRVLKPGGHLLAFGGTRTYHRLACAIEDAGFEMRDSIAWLYGSGFPKSLDVSKAIDKAAGAEREVVGARVYGDGTAGHWTPAETYAQDEWSTTARGKVDTAPATDAARTWRGWGTALKPAHEPIVVARKPLAGTVAANVLAHGTGALNIDGCRVAGTVKGWETPRGGIWTTDSEATAGLVEREGRWPANVVLDEHAAAELDRQSGITKDGVSGATGRGFQRGAYVGGEASTWDGPTMGYGGEGGASRFYYVAKAPTAERPRDGQTAHPTVKPLDLMRWLVRLVTPPGGTVLDPFAGSGTTAEACVLEHMRCITIERETAYLPLIVARLSKPLQVGFDFDGGAA